MTKNITCCKLVEGIKDFLDRSEWNKENEERRYEALEFIDKASHKIINRRIKEGVNIEGYPEPVGTSDSEYLFCEECRKGFEQQGELQHGLIMTEIEKEKREGTFYSNPEVQEILKGQMQRLDKLGKKQGLEKRGSELNFTKSPQE